MATPRKDLSRYGKDIFQLFYFLRWTGKAAVCFRSHTAARRARGILYAFRSAFLSQPDYKPDLTRVVRLTKMRIKDNTLSLEYVDDRHKSPGDDSPLLSRSRRLDNAGVL